MKQLLFLFTIFTTLMTHAQYDVNEVEETSSAKKSTFNWSAIKDNLYVGGDINASIGSASFIYFAPFIGYEFKPSFSAGVSGMVRYLSYNNGIGEFSKGTGVFVRFKPQIPLILESSFNIYSTSFNGVSQEALGANSWMFGIGYAYSMGSRSYSQIIVQYDVLKNAGVPENIMLIFPGGGRLYYKFGIVYYLND